jgi:hypothetical protein
VDTQPKACIYSSKLLPSFHHLCGAKFSCTGHIILLTAITREQCLYTWAIERKKGCVKNTRDEVFHNSKRLAIYLFSVPTKHMLTPLASFFLKPWMVGDYHSYHNTLLICQNNQQIIKLNCSWLKRCIEGSSFTLNLYNFTAFSYLRLRLALLLVIWSSIFLKAISVILLYLQTFAVSIPHPFRDKKNQVQQGKPPQLLHGIWLSLKPVRKEEHHKNQHRRTTYFIMR